MRRVLLATLLCLFTMPLHAADGSSPETAALQFIETLCSLEKIPGNPDAIRAVYMSDPAKALIAMEAAGETALAELKALKELLAERRPGMVTSFDGSVLRLDLAYTSADMKQSQKGTANIRLSYSSIIAQLRAYRPGDIELKSCALAGDTLVASVVMKNSTPPENTELTLKKGPAGYRLDLPPESIAQVRALEGFLANCGNYIRSARTEIASGADDAIGLRVTRLVADLDAEKKAFQNRK
jgi:hypothetical protein